MSNDERAPNWAKWRKMIRAELWQAVALSLNTEPDTVEGIDWRPISGGQFDGCPSDESDLKSQSIMFWQTPCTAWY